MMYRCAFLCSEDVLPGGPSRREDAFEVDWEIEALSPALKTHGIDLTPIGWKGFAAQADEFDCALPLAIWDYMHDRGAFLAEMKAAAKATQMFNDADILEWNSNKSYLAKMSADGVATIPSLTVDRVTEDSLAEAFDAFRCETLVAKPLVGAGGWRQARLEKGAAFPRADDLPPGAALIQPFEPGIVANGEYSFVFFGGVFSHALVKKPKSGDYRVQSLYGATEEKWIPSKVDLKAATDILRSAGEDLLYARVDLVRGEDGVLRLMEFELIEPYLYLPFSDKGADIFASALARKLGA